MEKGICFTAYVVGFVEEGELRWTCYPGKEKLSKVAIDLVASDINDKDEIYSHWFVESSPGRLKRKIGEWVDKTQKQIEESKEK